MNNEITELNQPAQLNYILKSIYDQFTYHGIKAKVLKRHNWEFRNFERVIKQANETTHIYQRRELLDLSLRCLRNYIGLGYSKRVKHSEITIESVKKLCCSRISLSNASFNTAQPVHYILDEQSVRYIMRCCVDDPPDPPTESPVQPAPYMCYPTNDPTE